METAVFRSLNEALSSLLLGDDEFVLVRHVLQPREKIELHYHKKAVEWLIIGYGIAEITVGNEKKIFNSSELLANDVMVFLFPKGVKHAIRAESEISYFVLRDKKDKIVYVR